MAKSIEKILAKKQALNDLYFECGAGLYSSQTLEYDVKFLIYCLSKFPMFKDKFPEAEAIIDGKTKHTIGGLFKYMRDRGITFEPDVETKLDDALTARNKLIHSYLMENAERIGITESREEMVKEVRELNKRILHGSKALEPLLNLFTELTIGKTVKQIKEDIIKQFGDADYW